MVDENTAMKLSDLVELFISEAKQYKNRQETKENLLNFHHRKTQLESLCKQGEMLSNCIVSMKNKKVKHSVPKRRLSPRIKSLSILIEGYGSSPEIIIQPNKLDIQAFEEMFSEIEEKLKNAWRSFTNYDRRADSFIKVADDDPSSGNALNKLKELVSELNNLKSILPERNEDIDYIKNIKRGISQECDSLEAEGLDEEIGKFLVEVRSVSGFPLKKLLESPNIIDWLNEKSRASSFTIRNKIH